MNDDRFERDVASVFAGMAPTHSPDGLLDDVFLTTGRMRPRPRWLALIKEPPMRQSSRVAVGSPAFRLVSVTLLTLVLLLLSLVAVGVGARVLSADSLPAPFGPARTGSLVYTAGGDIYLADPDGSDPRPIITGTPLDQIPWFSLEGTKLAFGRGSEVARYLMVADADGSDATRLAGPGDWWAEFLPGGKQMAVVQWHEGLGGLSLLDVDSGETIKDFELGPVVVDWWVYPRPPEGQELVFRGRPDAESWDRALYTVRLDGSGLGMIGAAVTDSEERASFLDPSFSPDGSTIVYWNWELAPDGADDLTYIHLRDLTTGEEIPVPFDPTGRAPQFSPDGASILFERGSDTDDNSGQLYVVPADGSGPATPVGPTFSEVDEYWYGFSPDGTAIYLGQAGNSKLIDLATGAITELTASGGPEAGGWQRLAN